MQDFTMQAISVFRIGFVPIAVSTITVPGGLDSYNGACVGIPEHLLHLGPRWILAHFGIFCLQRNTPTEQAI